jgi:hypothetical protein
MDDYSAPWVSHGHSHVLLATDHHSLDDRLATVVELAQILLLSPSRLAMIVHQTAFAVKRRSLTFSKTAG